MIELNKIGAHVGENEVSFGMYLPGVRKRDGYQVKVRVIHAKDQFTGHRTRDFRFDISSGRATWPLENKNTDAEKRRVLNVYHMNMKKIK